MCSAVLRQVPPNGLVIYTGTILTDEGKEKKWNIDFEPFKPINTSLYLCDNKFHTEALNELLEADNKYAIRPILSVHFFFLMCWTPGPLTHKQPRGSTCTTPLLT